MASIFILGTFYVERWLRMYVTANLLTCYFGQFGFCQFGKFYDDFVSGLAIFFSSFIVPSYHNFI